MVAVMYVPAIAKIPLVKKLIFGNTDPLMQEGTFGSKWKPKGELILSPTELWEYTGAKGSKGVYLAIMGKVYDVKKGAKHYGPGGGYEFFAGKDGTRAFVSGDFSEKGLIPDISGLSSQDMLGIEDWVKLYEKDYTYVGKVSGHFYDEKGEPTVKLTEAEKMLKEAHAWKKKQEDDNKKFPPCNSEWSQANGGRVWCSKLSGGINRNWVGVPRKLFKAGGKDSRCACIHEKDLTNANLKEYANCAPTAESCRLPKQ